MVLPEMIHSVPIHLVVLSTEHEQVSSPSPCTGSQPIHSDRTDEGFTYSRRCSWYSSFTINERMDRTRDLQTEILVSYHEATTVSVNN
ncbi:hypothetical protein EVAR_32947_1 [Eumeta japonica]|uniref:Uncharacterized protein n=1 Tax=Eumeta variegata TaxID=151549 RepID=A0A4C1X2R2_EUMVA|nr:hypothetical protein EVAR_32947_1 [Eumeta japonica]